uniref:Uncharacterized protein n=1 Tax=Oryza meridionalis TaxID=40149 RepID=A0A0E0D6A6_9ORYZ
MLPWNLLDHREGRRHGVPEGLMRLRRPDLVPEQHHPAVGVGERVHGGDEVGHGLRDVDDVGGDDEVEAARGGDGGEVRGAVPVELGEAWGAREVAAVAAEVAAERGEHRGDVREDEASTSMLEAKGEEILSWCEDDNFILEDDLAPDFEVPFLSMDLHALATHLSKLKLSERLFLEKDLLPEDLAVASEVNQIQIQSGTDVDSDAKGSLIHDHDSIRCDDQMKADCQLKCFEEDKSTSSPKTSSHSVHLDTGEDNNNSEGAKFEVVAAEEELDMLLNTLGGTHLSGSNLDESFGNKSTLQDVKVNQPDKKVTPSTSSKSSVTAACDDALDDLLSETSPSVQTEGLAEPGSTSKNDHYIDIRYANQIDITTSIDDLVDDLLTDTSLCLNGQKQTTSAKGKDNISSVSVPPNSGPSNASDDFDSWFDSL